MQADALDYSLTSSGIVDIYQLSASNYGDKLFIHPPIFVYTMAVLNYAFQVPLPVVSVVYHLLTAAAIVPLSYAVCESLSLSTCGAGSSAAVSLWALVIYCCCPVAAFCSQKIWIDNAASLAVTISALMHMYLVRVVHSDDCTPSASCSVRTSNIRHLLSGLVFGGIALNTKITCLALLPFLVLWSLWCTSRETLASAPRMEGWTRVVGEAAVRVACLVLGMAIGHAPWIALYYVSHTECNR